ncbi:MAG: hypothetical protein AMJ95_12670, partial [Omnitrophica WOR_2 bacterium SM23_72]
MNNSKGYLLALTTIFILFFVCFGAIAISMSGLTNQSAEKTIAGAQAFWFAEAGIQKGIWKINNDDAYWSGDDWMSISSGYETKDPLTVGGADGNFEVEITGVGDKFVTIRSYGYIPYVGDTPDKDTSNYAKRIIRAMLYRNAFNYGIQAKESIRLGGSVVDFAKTDSYDSSIGYDPTNPGDDGDIATNGDITINGDKSRVFVRGNANYGINGSYSGSEAQVSGDELPLEAPLQFPEIIVPAEFSFVPSGGAITGSTTIDGSANFYVYSSISLQEDAVLTIQGPAAIYLTDSGTSCLSLTGQSQIAVEGDGPVVIYANGDVNLAGGGVTNDNPTHVAANFQLYGVGGGDFNISLTGNTDFCGVIYAPDSDIKIAG